jgi:hypothetical protein
MATGERNTKICGICGKDVSRAARVKDETGAYYCEGACFQQHKAQLHMQRGAPPSTASAASPPPPPQPQHAQPRLAKPPAQPPADLSANPAFLDISKASKSTGPRCPACGSPMKNDESVLCTTCGYSKKRGGKLNTRVGVDKEPSSKKGIVIDINPWVLCGVLCVIFGGTLIASTMSEQFLLIHALVLGIFGLIVHISLIVNAFKEGDGLWGIILLLGPFVPCVNFFAFFAILYYLFVICDSPVLKMAWAVNVIFQIITAIFNFERLMQEYDSQFDGGGGSFTDDGDGEVRRYDNPLQPQDDSQDALARAFNAWVNA